MLQSLKKRNCWMFSAGMMLMLMLQAWSTDGGSGGQKDWIGQRYGCHSILQIGSCLAHWAIL